MTVDVKYWTEAVATGGGRNGLAKLSDGKMTVTMASPKELGGSGAGHNPEELFALGYAACYLSSMRFAATTEKLGAMPETASVKAKVGLGPRPDGGYGLTVRLDVAMPGLERAAAEKIVERGHQICPYSNGTRGNVDVVITLV